MKRSGPGMLMLLVLAGCMDMPDVTKFRYGSAQRPDAVAIEDTNEMQTAADAAETRSAIIDDLLTRRSILPPAGPYAEVSRAVIAASSGATEAELRVARLRAEAKSQNWLPQVGPVVSLTSLGDVATKLLIEQVLFDNGARKAERAHAAADVEVAAVSLSEALNARVHEGLSHYIKAQRAQEQAVLADRAVARMSGYGQIMLKRVEGGLSDMSEQRVIDQKIAEMQAVLDADRQLAAQSMAELQALAQQPLTHLSGLQEVQPDQGHPEPLSVLLARGEGARTKAAARVERAQHLPGLTASGNWTKDDGLVGGLDLGLGKMLGFGTGATLEAIASTDEVVDRQMAEAADTASRKIVALQSELQRLSAKQGQGAGVLAQTEASLAMFTEQYKLGRRPLMELVSIYESFAQMEREQAALKYDIALTRLQIAALRGQLVDGDAL